MADSLIGASFSDYVYEQINTRQSRLSVDWPRDRTWQSWANSNTAFVRLASSIDVNNDKGAMAQKYPLFNTKFNGDLASGVGLGGNTAYGWELDPTEGYGFAIPPGIISADIKAQNRGSLREANIEILCSNKKQFEIISKLYLRLGYTMLLEWGWSTYYDNNGDFKGNYHNVATSAFFFDGNKTPEDILEQINVDRKKSCGNYDAIVGVVSNYSWNMEKDGSYKITLSLKTWGDITESLKNNTSTGGEATTANSGSTELEKSANRSDLHKIMYAIADELYTNDLTEKAEIEDWWVVAKTKVECSQWNFKTGMNSGQSEAIQLEFNEDLTGAGKDDTYHQYITLGALTRIMQDFVLMYNTAKPGNNKNALVNVDYKMDFSYCLAPEYFMSLDPRVCMVDFTQAKYTPAGVEIPDDGEEGQIKNVVQKSKFREQDYIGRTKFIWVNISHIIKVLDSYIVRETGAVSVYDFLQNLMKDIQSALGNINNFEVIYDEDKNMIRIIDSAYIPGLEKVYPTEFSRLSTFIVNTMDQDNGSFLRDAKIQSKLSNAFATQITVGAQANGDVVGSDATLLSKFNKGLIDRLVEEKGNANTVDKYKLEEKYRITNNQYKYEVDYGTITDDFINNNKQTMIDLYRYTINKEVKDENISPPGFLPIDLEITMDGLSGIKIYENYTVDSRMLPQDYQNNVKFITTGVSHRIQNNDWTTTLNSVMSPIGNFKPAPVSTPPGGTPNKTQTQKSKPNPNTNTKPVPQTNKQPSSTSGNNSGKYISPASKAPIDGTYYVDVTKTLNSATMKKLAALNGGEYPIKFYTDPSGKYGNTKFGRVIDENGSRNVYESNPIFDANLTTWSYTGKTGFKKSAYCNKLWIPTLTEMAQYLDSLGMWNANHIDGWSAGILRRDVTPASGVEYGLLSGHAFGMAIDINSGKYPLGSKGVAKWEKDYKAKVPYAIVHKELDNYFGPKGKNKIFWQIGSNDAHHFSVGLSF